MDTYFFVIAKFTRFYYLNLLDFIVRFVLSYTRRIYMKKGIVFYWGFNQYPKERAKLLQKVGFDNVIINADSKFNRQNGKIGQQIKWFKQYNLGISSLHMRYNGKDLPYFWTDGKKGNWMEKRLAKDIKVAHKYGIKHVVTHLKGTPSQVGLDRVNRLLKLCDKYDVNLAIENTENIACFMHTFKNISHPHLKFCLDVGHNHCFNPEIDYFKDFGDKLVCLHLHDNDGTRDAHTLNRYGNIDWDNIAKNLAEINYKGSLDYEVMCPGDELDCEQTAREVYKQACELDKLIRKYKKELKNK